MEHFGLVLVSKVILVAGGFLHFLFSFLPGNFFLGLNLWGAQFLKFLGFFSWLLFANCFLGTAF